ncbi:biopolymer transport protein TolR [Lishizhenia tianjinensis]|uniref:Biopolymer transport protein TolR n=1 Tax=Lishizhenia tianjinensis TaxID=477690 RepID=A0A1I7ALT7_9FLAO|nr:biopolymer transporter ExbD [Lishizhenia tianjinensis]SFT75897.1 biopolymer transport protein TolR [Lishizhenia tianjinensis]
MGFGTQNKVKAEGGMASMTDLVFLLLVFFIIMSTMSENNTPVDLPKPSEKLDPSKTNTTTTVIVTADNLYQIMSGQLDDASNPFNTKTEGGSYEQVKAFLVEQVEANPERKLKIAGSREAKYEAVFQILALAKNREWNPALAYD